MCVGGGGWARDRERESERERDNVKAVRKYTGTQRNNTLQGKVLSGRDRIISLASVLSHSLSLTLKSTALRGSSSLRLIRISKHKADNSSIASGTKRSELIYYTTHSFFWLPSKPFYRMSLAFFLLVFFYFSDI